MIATTGLEVRAGSSLLLENAGLRVGKGDRIGLVGRNGAGKTTLTRILAQESQPAAGVVQVSGTVGYLPQDPRSGNPDEIARDRVLSARGLHDVVRRMHEASQGMGTDDEAERERLIARYARAEAEFESLGGYAVESQAAAIAASVGLPERVLAQPLGTLSGGQRRRIELARILFGGSDVLLLDEPTNHLDLDSILWLEQLLLDFSGSIITITHDRSFLDRVATRIVELDRGQLRNYPGNYSQYQQLKQEQLQQEAVIQAKADKLLAAEEVWIRKGVEARRTRSQSRIGRLEQLRAARAEIGRAHV